VVDRLSLVGGGTEAFDEGPKGRKRPVDGLGTARLFGGGVRLPPIFLRFYALRVSGRFRTH
jgi:hypothetical protein